MAYKLWTTEVITSSDVDTYLMRQCVISCTSTTRPPAVTGMHIWETDTNCERYYNGSTWVYLKEESKFAMKTVDDAKYDTDELALDNEMKVLVSANTTYFLDAFLIYSSSGTAGLQIAIEHPSDTEFYFSPNSQAGSPTYSVDRDNFMYDHVSNYAPSAARTYIGWGTTSNCVSWIRDIAIRTGTLTGYIGIKWCQAVAELSDTTIRANSYLHLRRAPG